MCRKFKYLGAVVAIALGLMGCEGPPNESAISQNPFPPGQNPTPPVERTSYRVYLTSLIHNTNFAAGFANGIAGADAFCMSDPGKPADLSSAKAMLVDGTNRAACSSAFCGTGGPTEHTDWVFKPGKDYTLADGTTLLATADANGLLPFPLAHNLGGSGLTYFTGMANTWQTSGFDCSGWSHVGVGNAFVGHDNGSVTNPSGSTFLAAFGLGIQCTSTVKLLCVEQ